MDHPLSPGTRVRHNHQKRHRKAHASESPPRRRAVDEVNKAASAQKEVAHPTTTRTSERQRRRPSLSAMDVLLGNGRNQRNKNQNSLPNLLSRNVLMGLTVAGVAQSLLTTIFRLFHVDVFLEAYQLPLESYSSGSLAVSIITTITSVVGSWMVDHTATRRHRATLVGPTGVYFVACFLTPFFAYHPRFGTLHFIITISLYQTLYSYMAILLGSIVTDSHTMTQETRVKFMASGKAFNLVASFIVGRIALLTFHESNLHSFRLFLGVLAGVTLFLFALADSMIQGTRLWQYLKSLRNWKPFQLLWHRYYDETDWSSPSHANDMEGSSSSALSYNNQPKKLYWRRIVQDFGKHHNFRVWVVMEMLLHMQITFNANFLKTFVDSLLVEDFGRDTCDWLLSLVGPMSQLATIMAYLPIQKWGYPKIYLILFLSNLVLSNTLYWFVGSSSSYGILVFLMVYSISTRAVQSAGFHLAMADMVLEMKRKHAKDGRYDEPSVAGLFMGANALLCKPVESLLPMLAANVMEFNGASRPVLFYLLVWPPMVCSVLQIFAWTSFNLTPHRVSTMRRELREHDFVTSSSFVDILDA